MFSLIATRLLPLLQASHCHTTASWAGSVEARGRALISDTLSIHQHKFHWSDLGNTIKHRPITHKEELGCYDCLKSVFSHFLGLSASLPERIMVSLASDKRKLAGSGHTFRLWATIIPFLLYMHFIPIRRALKSHLSPAYRSKSRSLGLRHIFIRSSCDSQWCN